MTGQNYIVVCGEKAILNLTKICNDLVTFEKFLQSSIDNESSVLFLRSRPNNREIFLALKRLLNRNWHTRQKGLFLSNGYFVCRGREAYIGIDIDGTPTKATRLLVETD